jgi:hypothetical protein
MKIHWLARHWIWASYLGWDEWSVHGRAKGCRFPDRIYACRGRNVWRHVAGRSDGYTLADVKQCGKNMHGAVAKAMKIWMGGRCLK